MDLGFLAPAYAASGPVATAYLDTTSAVEGAAAKIAGRWRARREELAAQGADEATLEAMGEAAGRGVRPRWPDPARRWGRGPTALRRRRYPGLTVVVPALPVGVRRRQSWLGGHSVGRHAVAVSVVGCTTGKRDGQRHGGRSRAGPA